MNAPERRETEEFSLSTGGILFALTKLLGLSNHPTLRALFFTAVAWLPLLILSAIAGVAVGSSVRIPFLMDYGVYGRLLVAIPILILAEIIIDKRCRDVLRKFMTSRFVREEDIPLVDSAVHNAARQKNSILAEIAIIAIIYTTTLIRSHVILPGHLSTWYYSGSKITPAGWYFALVSLPMFQFLLIRWLLRLAIWAGLLWRISRLNLQLLPIHPDRMGGLSFLGLAQVPFGLVGLAGGAVISTSMINSLIYWKAPLSSFTAPIVTYIVLAVIIIIAPILVFIDKLIALRASGILRYGDLGEEYAKLFDARWVDNAQPDYPSLLGTSDIQSLADLANSMNIVLDMRIIPADYKTIVFIAAAAAIPMIPLFFVALPFEQIIARVLGMLG